jgi:ligand-binding sensor domain-containing protein/signal transduction histidine kinase
MLDPAQVAREFSQRSWQKKDGLPDNQVQALLQTRDGFLWIGTHRGLARFDGFKFVVFDHLNTPEMPDDNCKSLAEDTGGNLWIATDDGLIRARDGSFKRFTRKDGLTYPPEDTTDRIGFVFADRRGGIWITPRWSVDLLQDGVITHFLEADGDPAGTVLALQQDSAGVLWAGGRFLHRFNERKATFEFQPDSQRQWGVVAMQDDGDGGLWLLCVKTAKAGWLYHLKDGVWEKSSDELEFDPRSLFLSSDHSGGVWMATVGNVLNRFHDEQFTRYSLPSEMAHDFVLCLKEDREGNLWFGTEYSGLHCWKPKAISAYSAREGLAHDSTWTMCEALDDSVWIGTEQGVSQFKDGRFRNFTKLDGLSGDKIRSVAEDDSGAIWVGTGSGLSVIRAGAVQQQPFPHLPELNKIRVVLPAKSGAVWVGTVAGLFRFEGGQWTTFTPTNGLAKAGLYGDVLALREDKAGNLWIGTAGGGLQSYRDGKFTTWTTTNGLSNNFVWALHEDADGVLWIGNENGLNRYENGRFTAFTTREGLPADLVNEILEDDSGNLWISHDHGIYRVRKQELNDVAAGRAKQVQAVSYDESDGLPSNETNGQKSQPAGCKTRDGRLWFPTTKGVAVINPKLCDLDAVAPQAAIEQVRADGEVVFNSGAGVAATPPSPEGDDANPLTAKSRATGASRPPPFGGAASPPLRLPPGSGRVLEFRFTAPVFTAPEKAAFRYRLRGADDRWIDAGNRREAYFTRLRPGDYSFEVMAANHRGVWGEKVAGFAFSIALFYYQTWWFYLVCGLGTTGMLGALVFWRMRELRKLHRLEQSSAITDERTRIAKDLHDGLGADLTRLALLADLAEEEDSATVGAHRQKLSQSSREAARTLKEMIWIANPANDTVEGLVSRICQTAEDFLSDARIRCRLELAPQLPQRSLSLDQRRNLLLVAREALNNIIKHAAATEVCIRANGRDNNFHLEIEDNGRGFDPASARPDGLGLASMRRRVENLGGSFDLESRPGAGTRILIMMKLSESK